MTDTVQFAAKFVIKKQNISSCSPKVKSFFQR